MTFTVVMFTGGFATFTVDFATFKGTFATFTGVCDIYWRLRRLLSVQVVLFSRKVFGFEDHLFELAELVFPFKRF